MTKFVVVKFQVEGIHRWDKCDIAEVNYLSTPHRHIFHITAVKKVDHNNRDIEFIALKHRIQSALEAEFYNADRKLLDFGNASCEDIAEMLAHNYDLQSCEVLEDGENGAIVVAEELL